ncbi:MAG: GDSL-type esterase/lipase family protein [Nitrososphaerales archaeon]
MCSYPEAHEDPGEPENDSGFGVKALGVDIHCRGLGINLIEEKTKGGELQPGAEPRRPAVGGDQRYARALSPGAPVGERSTEVLMSRSVRFAAMAALSAVTLLLAPTGRAVAGTTDPASEYYVALGASLVTGTGSTNGADYVNDLLAYAQPLIPGLVVENLACGGETTTTMLHGGHCAKYTTGSQLGDAETFLKDHPGQVAFVTIDIGADDVLGCASNDVVNESCFETGLSKVEANLPQIVSGLRAASSTVPIVGMNYYDPFLAYWLNGSSGQEQAKESVGLVKQLNEVLSSDYANGEIAVASPFKKFHTTDFRRSGIWKGQQVPANVATICNWTWMCTPGGPTVHANNTGYAELAKAFEKVLVVPPSLSGTPPIATVGQQYSFAFTISGIPRARVHNEGLLPKGLRLSEHGVLSGRPSQTGTYPFSVIASNGKARTIVASESVTVGHT